MSNYKSPRWEIGQTIYFANQAVALGNKYKVDIESRLKPGELDELGSFVPELEGRRSGQSEILTTQKARTQDQNITIDTLHQDVMDVRDTVKGVSDDTGILKAFGIGEKIQKNVSSVTAAGNMILNGYADHTEWANTEAGILDEDVELINADVLALSTADNVQEGSKFQRKAGTMDKNTLQRRVEDLVIKISVTGVRVFRKKDPAVVALFEGLIPKS
jgi:hypothetical protein